MVGVAVGIRGDRDRVWGHGWVAAIDAEMATSLGSSQISPYLHVPPVTMSLLTLEADGIACVTNG